jgi:hypothetical protein
MITVNNYLNQAAAIDFSTLPEPLRKGDDLARKALQNSGQTYKSNETIKRVVDTFLEKLNAYLKANPQPTEESIPEPKAAPALPRVKKEVVKPAQRAAKPKTTVKVAAKVESKAVELIPEEIRFIRRYVAMHGKVKTRTSVLQLLSSLQKAMIEKRIRKTSAYAKEILQIQDQLIKAADRMGEAAEISITKANLDRYREITSSERIRDSIALLKRFVALHGREGVQDKAERLIASMERMVKSGKVTKDDPYSARLNEAYKSLKLYVREKKKTPEIQASELNGIYGLLGMSPNGYQKNSTSKAAGLSGVVSSSDLMQMDFDTIGLKGKFRDLIGDPSVGFTAMVFGQPKSGKSTLMLEFAHHLALNHGEVLYVAIEEGYGYTLKEKIARIGAIHPRLNLSEQLPKDVSSYDFVFIDSVSRAGMELEDLVRLKNRYPRTSFVFIFHATKDGKFRGGNELAHEVDVIIEVENKMATASGRFNDGGQLRL